MGDVAVSEAREELREVARRLLAAAASTSAARALLDDPVGHDPRLWHEVARLGWVALAVPEELGGAGGALADQLVVLEELGRNVVASPLPSTVLATQLVLLAGSDEQRRALVPRLAAGEATASPVLTGPSGRFDQLGAPRLDRNGSRWSVRGHAAFAPDAHTADVLVVAARRDDELCLAVVEPGRHGVTVRPTATVDQTRRLCAVDFDNVDVDTDAVLDLSGPALAGGVANLAAVAIAADCVGGAQRALEMAVDYARQRVQFDRPIGSFQAVKHRCADMFVQVEGARAALERASEVLARSLTDRDAALAASVAKAYGAAAYVKVAGDAVQVHGGIGFTWEHDGHLYLKRARLDAALFGDATWHHDRIAALLATRCEGTPG